MQCLHHKLSSYINNYYFFQLCLNGYLMILMRVNEQATASYTNRIQLTRLQCIGSVAPPPHLSLFPRLHVVNTHLLHGVRERLEERGLVRGVQVHKRLRPRVRRHDLIASQQPHPPLQIHEVHVVEFPGGHGVVEGGDGGVVLVVGAELSEPLDVFRVHGGVVIGARAEVEDPVGELGAVGEADGVGPGEGYHLLDVEALGGEGLDDGGEGHVGEGDVAGDVGGAWLDAVLAAEADGEVGPADHGDEVAGGLGEDVGAGDDAGALELELGLGARDDVEGVAGEGLVDVAVALGLVEVVGGDEEGGVAAADDAVVEEEAEGAGGGGGNGELFLHHHVLDDLGEFGAGLVVVVEGELWFGGGEEWDEEEEEREQKPWRHCRCSEVAAVALGWWRRRNREFAGWLLINCERGEKVACKWRD